MVPVPFYHAFQQADMFLVDPGQAVFFDDQDAQTVTCVQQFRSHGIVRRAVGVASEFLETFQTESLQRVGNCGPGSGVVLVHVHSFQLQGFPVQQESPVRVETDVTYSGGGHVGVHELSVT